MAASTLCRRTIRAAWKNHFVPWVERLKGNVSENSADRVPHGMIVNEVAEFEDEGDSNDAVSEDFTASEGEYTMNSDDDRDD